MKTDRKADRIKEILESLDRLQKAEAPPFLFTRLQARLNNLQEGAHARKALSKPALSLAILTLLLLVNLVFVSRYMKTHVPAGAGNSPTSGIQQLVQEYDLESSFVYNDKSAR